MSATIPVALFCITGLLWLATWLCAHRLLHLFCDRFPLIAQRELPYAFDRGFAHPEKVIFFLRRRAAEVLHGDPSLWRQRQRLIRLSALSLLVPMVGFVTIGVVAFMASQR